MKTLSCIVFLAVLSFSLAGCSKETTEEATASTIQPASPPAAESPAAPAAAQPRAVAPAPAPRNEAPKVADVPKPIQVPASTELSVILIDSLSSGKNKAGDTFMASLAEPIVVNGQTVAVRGTKVEGRVVEAEGSGRVSGRASMSLVLTSIANGGKSYSIVTKPFATEAESTKKR